MFQTIQGEINIKKMKRKILRLILAASLWAAAIVSIFIWYDWKLLVILFLFLWAGNVERSNN